MLSLVKQAYLAPLENLPALLAVYRSLLLFFAGMFLSLMVVFVTLQMKGFAFVKQILVIPLMLCVLYLFPLLASAILAWQKRTLGIDGKAVGNFLVNWKDCKYLALLLIYVIIYFACFMVVMFGSFYAALIFKPILQLASFWVITIISTAMLAWFVKGFALRFPMLALDQQYTPELKRQVKLRTRNFSWFLALYAVHLPAALIGVALLMLRETVKLEPAYEVLLIVFEWSFAPYIALVFATLLSLFYKTHIQQDAPEEQVQHTAQPQTT